MLVYRKNYAQDILIHREMLTQILDRYIKEKKTDKLAYWVSKIDKGYLSYESEYIQKSIAILGQLLFDKFQALEKKGRMKEALTGYESIYESKQYPNKIKAEAAYAIATMNQEQNQAISSHKWLTKSLELYEDKDLIKITPSLLVLAKGYRLLQNFELSSKLSFDISKRFCDKTFIGKEGFYELVISNNAIENTDSSKLISLENNFNDCGFTKRFLEKTQIENFELLILNDQLSQVKSYFLAHSNNDKLARQMGRYLKFKFWQSTPGNKNKIREEINAMNSSIPSLDLNGMFLQYDRVMDFRKKVNELNFLFTVTTPFDDEKFNSEIEQYFSIITELNKEAVTLSKDCIPQEIILIREVLSLPYFSLVNSINSYVPQGVDNRYLEGFKKGMRQITVSLEAKALQIEREKVAFLDKNTFFFEVQKYDRFTDIKLKSRSVSSSEVVTDESDNEEHLNLMADLKEGLNFHSAFIFSNTLDFGKSLRN